MESRAFSMRSDDAFSRYRAGALSAVTFINELIELARDVRAAQQRGETHGLSPEELGLLRRRG